MAVGLSARLTAPRPALGWIDVGIGTALAVLVMTTVTHWRSAIIPIDPWDYVEGAVNFPDGKWNAVGLSRWGMVAPLMLLGRLWGEAEASYYVYPILAGGLLSAVLYALAARLVDRWTGIAGSLLVCSTAVVFVHLSRGYPDVIATAFLGLALLALVLARDRMRDAAVPLEVTSHEAAEPGLVRASVGSATHDSTGRNPAPGVDGGGAASGVEAPQPDVPAVGAESPARRQPIPLGVLAWVLLAGTSAAWAFEVRELTLLAWPVLAWSLLRVSRRLGVIAAFLSVPVLAALLDLYLSWRVYGDPLLKLNGLTGNSIASSEVEADTVYLGHDRWYYLTVPVRILWGRSGGPALAVALLIGLVGGALLRRRLGPLWHWGASTAVLLVLAGGVVTPGAPLIRLDIVRYNLAYAIPLALSAVCVVSVLLRASSGRRRLVVAVAAAVLALGSVAPSARFVATFEGLAPNGGNSLRELDSYLRGVDGLDRTRIWSDWGTQRLLRVYSVGPFGQWHWDPRGYRSLNRLLRGPAVPADRLPAGGDLVVVYSRDDQTCYHCNVAIHEIEDVVGPFPLPGWQEVFRSSAGNLVVYRLPPGYAWPHVVGSAAP